MEQEILENICYMMWDIFFSEELKGLSLNSKHPSAIQYSTFALSIVICIIGFAANIIVIFTTGFLMKKNIYKIWFLNLALADFIFLLFLPLHAVSVLRLKWPYGSNMCKFHNFLSFVNTYASIYILTALNIDRALSVAKPIWHRRFYSWTFCCYICALIWILSFLCGIPAIIYSDVYGESLCTLSYQNTSYFDNIRSYNLEEIEVAVIPREMCRILPDLLNISETTTILTVWRAETLLTLNLVVPLAVLGYVVPLCVILVSNVIIALHVKKSKTVASSRLYRVVIVSVLSFFCARTPYVLTYIILLASMHTLKMTLMYKLSVILPLLFTIAATNSFLNPLVYVLVGKQVRSEIIHFFRKKLISVREERSGLATSI